MGNCVRREVGIEEIEDNDNKLMLDNIVKLLYNHRQKLKRCG